MLRLIFEHPVATCFFLFFIFSGIEVCIKDLKSENKKDTSKK